MTRALLLLSSDAPPVEVRCDGCRHWDNPKAYQNYYGTCIAAQGIGRPIQSDGDQENIITKPDFGCVMFEAKP